MEMRYQGHNFPMRSSGNFRPKGPLEIGGLDRRSVQA